MRQSVARWPCRRGSGSVSWCELAPCAEVSVTVGQLLSASEAAPSSWGSGESRAPTALSVPWLLWYLPPVVWLCRLVPFGQGVNVCPSAEASPAVARCCHTARACPRGKRPVFCVCCLGLLFCLDTRGVGWFPASHRADSSWTQWARGCSVGPGSPAVCCGGAAGMEMQPQHSGNAP